MLDDLVAGDAGCDDPYLVQTAIGFDASGLDQAEPVRLHVYIFRDRDAYERLRSTIDACVAVVVTDPATFEFVDDSPFVLAGQGPWSPNSRQRCAKRSRWPPAPAADRTARTAPHRRRPARTDQTFVRDRDRDPSLLPMAPWDDGATVRGRAALDAPVMAPHRPSTRFAVPSFLLAIALVAGSAAPTIARDAAPAVPPKPADSVARPNGPSDPTSAAILVDPTADTAWRRYEAITPDPPAAPPVAEVREPVTVPDSKPRVASTSTATSGGTASPASFKGRNHVWIPALGINRSVTGFACSSQAYPGNRVYRWGCAGGNNVYLFGHAHSVFKALHDAYVSGRLRKGMAVYYAGGDGVVHRYSVRWWKVTTPDQWRLGLRRPVATEHDPPDLRRGSEPVPPDRPARPGLTGAARVGR